MVELTRDEVRALAREVGVTDPVSYDAMTRLVNAALAKHDSAWWALVMGAAACVEDAANCLRDADAKKAAQGAAKHYREAAQKLATADGVQPSADLLDAAEFSTDGDPRNDAARELCRRWRAARTDGVGDKHGD